MEPVFIHLLGCGKNTGQAYAVTAIIGDCFCPDCGEPIVMEQPGAPDNFTGQCGKCRTYINAVISLSPDGRTGTWVIL